MAYFEANGKIVNIGQKESGVSKSNKDWEKVEFAIETQEQYPKTIAFTLFNQNCEIIDDKELGDEVSVKFNVESREYNGRWFHNVNAFGISVLNKTEEPEIGSQPKSVSEEDGDGLPF